MLLRGKEEKIRIDRADLSQGTGGRASCGEKMSERPRARDAERTLFPTAGSSETKKRRGEVRKGSSRQEARDETDVRKGKKNHDRGWGPNRTRQPPGFSNNKREE